MDMKKPTPVDSSEVSFEEAIGAVNKHQQEQFKDGMDETHKDRHQEFQYKGFWKKPQGIKVKMEASGRGVRCVDCEKKKKCRMRVNKHVSKACKDFVVDIQKQSNLNDQKAKDRKRAQERAREVEAEKKWREDKYQVTLMKEESKTVPLHSNSSTSSKE